MKIILLIILSFAGCCKKCKNANEANDKHEKELISAMTNNEKTNLGVSMIGMTDKINIQVDSSLNLTLINNLPYSITTGFSYKIEKYDDEKWEQCKYSIALNFDDLGIIVEAHSEYEFNIDLLPQYTCYKTGLYRIVKEVIIERKAEELYLEFTILANDIVN